MFSESSLGKLLPQRWFCTDHTRVPINKINVLICAYVFTMAATLTTFATLYIYYDSVKIDEVLVTATVLDGYNCSALRKDDYYGKILTENACMENYFPLNSDSLHCSGSGSCNYYPFGEKSPAYSFQSSNCEEIFGDYEQWRVPVNTKAACGKWYRDSELGYFDGRVERGLIGPIDLPLSFDLDTECPGFSAIYGSSSSCMMQMSGSDASSESYAIIESGSCDDSDEDTYEKGCKLISPWFDESDYSDYYTHCDNYNYEGGLLITDMRLSSCEAFKKQCMLLALPDVLKYQDTERNCHPCSAFRTNSPFLCTRKKNKSPLEILSLAAANTSAVLGILTAVFATLLRSKTFMEDYRKDSF